MLTLRGLRGHAVDKRTGGGSLHCLVLLTRCYQVLEIQSDFSSINNICVLIIIVMSITGSCKTDGSVLVS